MANFPRFSVNRAKWFWKSNDKAQWLVLKATEASTRSTYSCQQLSFSSFFFFQILQNHYFFSSFFILAFFLLSLSHSSQLNNYFKLTLQATLQQRNLFHHAGTLYITCFMSECDLFVQQITDTSKHFPTLVTLKTDGSLCCWQLRRH